MGDMFRPRLGHHQALVKNTDYKKLTHKMQRGVPQVGSHVAFYEINCYGLYS